MVTVLQVCLLTLDLDCVRESWGYGGFKDYIYWVMCFFGVCVDCFGVLWCLTVASILLSL